MARAPVSKTGGWGFEVPPLLPATSNTYYQSQGTKRGLGPNLDPSVP